MAGKKGRRSLMSALEGGGGGGGGVGMAAAVVGKTGRKKSRTPKKGATPKLTCKRKVPETPVRGLAASAGEIRLQLYNYTHNMRTTKTIAESASPATPRPRRSPRNSVSREPKDGGAAGSARKKKSKGKMTMLKRTGILSRGPRGSAKKKVKTPKKGDGSAKKKKRGSIQPAPSSPGSEARAMGFRVKRRATKPPPPGASPVRPR